MPLKLKEQMKTGSPITLIQLIISIVVLLLGGIGLYVKSEVRAQHNEDRIEVIERKMDKNEANAQLRKVSRDDEIKVIRSDVGQNKQDIEILKATKKDK